MASEGTVELCQAILHNKIDEVRQRIETSSNPKELVNGVCFVENYRGRDYTPLLLAAEHGFARAEIMSILLDAGAVDAYGKDRTIGFPARKYDRFSLFSVVIDRGDINLAVHLAKETPSIDLAIQYVDYLLGQTSTSEPMGSWFLKRPIYDDWDPIGALQMATVELLSKHGLVDEGSKNARPAQIDRWIAASLDSQCYLVLRYIMSRCGCSGWEFLWKDTNWRNTFADRGLEWLNEPRVELAIRTRRLPLLRVWLTAGVSLGRARAELDMAPLAYMAYMVCGFFQGLQPAISRLHYITAMLQLKCAGCRLDVDNNEIERAAFEELHRGLPECAQALVSVQPLHLLCANAIRRSLPRPVPVYTNRLPIPACEQRFVASELFDIYQSLVPAS